MQCHYCERQADVAVEKDDLTVGVCEKHLRERLETLEETEWLAEFDEQLDVDRTE